jgi:hypothetical protein
MAVEEDLKAPKHPQRDLSIYGKDYFLQQPFSPDPGMS